MRTPHRTLVEAVVLALALVAPAFAAAATGLDVEVAIEPAPQHETAYRCTATLRDQATGETLAAPTVLFRRGEDATVSAELEGGQGIRLTVGVAASGDAATYRAELLDRGKVVSSQRATVTFRRAG